jgi:hypothetical protein
MNKVIKISGRKNTKQYVEVCEICGAQYIATRSGSHVCSSVCRAQKARDKKKKQFKIQSKVIQNQTAVINLLTLKPDPELESNVIIQEPDLSNFERVASCWKENADMLRTVSNNKCDIFIIGTMKNSVDIYRRKDCPMEKRHWGGLWVCECELPITHDNYRKECKYYSR